MYLVGLAHSLEGQTLRHLLEMKAAGAIPQEHHGSVGDPLYYMVLVTLRLIVLASSL
jgi:hypothetical protein